MSTPIECKLARQGGTFAEVGGIEYHFQTYTDGAHVCVVDDESHADRFLEIREGYKLYRGDGQPVKGAKPVVTEKAKEPEKVAQPEAKAEPEQAKPISERDALEAEYETLYGKAPHHKTSDQKIRELIAAKK